MQARFIRNLLVLCMSVALGHTATAQNAARIYIEPNGWSIGTNFGMSDLWGDVGTKSAIAHYTNSKYFDKVAFMGGMFGRYTVHPAFDIRLSLNFGSLYATDAWNEDGAKGKSLVEGNDFVQRYLRSQNAKAIMIEMGAIFELVPFRANPESKAAHRRGQPFLGAGFGYFHYVPYSTAGKGTRFIKTYDLSLEGQGFGDGFPEKKPQWQPFIPIVIGYRWDMGRHLNLGIEYMYRMTFFDYLDGVSGNYLSYFDYRTHMPEQDANVAMQIADKTPYYNNSLASTPGTQRGNPGNNDSYSTISITFFYKVHNNEHEWWH